MKNQGFKPADFVMGVSFRKNPGASWVVMGGHCRDVMGHCHDVMAHCRDVMAHGRDVMGHVRDVMAMFATPAESILPRVHVSCQSYHQAPPNTPKVVWGFGYWGAGTIPFPAPTIEWRRIAFLH